MMRVRAISALICTAMLSAAAACASAAMQPTGAAASASAAVASATSDTVSKLGPIGQITNATQSDAPSSALAAAGASTGTWLNLTSSAGDYLSEEKARWIAGVIISEVWKTRHDAGDNSVVGGSLAPMPASGPADGAGVNLTFTPDMQKIMFTAQDGTTPSKLTVPDQAAYRSAVQAAAAAVGLSVTSVAFTQSLGTVVQIDELATDPVGFLQKYPRTNPGLTLDPSDVEGVFLVIRDSAGKIVKTSAWSTGSQSGEGGPGPDYGDVASGGETTAEAAPTATPT